MALSMDYHNSGSMVMDAHAISNSFESTAAVKLQKVYRSYRTRRRLADSAVVAEELWWQAIDYARLNYSTVSFFNFNKPETAASRWSRISLNASKVGKGLGKDEKAQKLAFQHWIEAIDPRHRYGHNLNLYYEEWCKEDAEQPFFYWLDVGDGKEIDLKDCPRPRLLQECIKYLGPQEREQYEYVIAEGMVVHKQTGNLLDTKQGLQGSKWIFVMSTCKKLYAGEKKKGLFHHSSFLSGGATLAAGRFTAKDGKLRVLLPLGFQNLCDLLYGTKKYFDGSEVGMSNANIPKPQSVSTYSGHYHPTNQNLGTFLDFLKENGVILDDIQVLTPTEDCGSYDPNLILKVDNQDRTRCGQSVDSKPSKLHTSCKIKNYQPSKSSITSETKRTCSYKRMLSGNFQSPKTNVPKKDILQRIKSKKEASSYQLGHQLPLKWSTGAGPRIWCIADYPPKLREQALTFVNLSPSDLPKPSASQVLGVLLSIQNLCRVM